MGLFDAIFRKLNGADFTDNSIVEEIVENEVKEEEEATVNSEEETEESYVAALVKYFSYSEPKSLQSVKAGKMTKEAFMEKAEEFLKNTVGVRDEEVSKRVLDSFEKNVWGYGIADDLINDPDITDIKFFGVGPRRARIKVDGVRMPSPVYFKSERELETFYHMIANKNSQGTSLQQSIGTFTDNESSEEFSLRVTVGSGHVATNEKPTITIRKNPKRVREPEEFIGKGMLTKKQYDYVADLVNKGVGVTIFGAGGTRKTSFLNTIKEEVSEQDAMLVIQENDEITEGNHPECIIWHIVENSGDGKVNYDLEALSKKGLLMDITTFCISEIKGAEAYFYLNAANSGTRTMGTLHAYSCEAGIEQLISYAKLHGSGKSFERADFLRKMEKLGLLIHIESDVHTGKICIDEMLMVKGFDEKKQALIYENVLGKAI